MSEGKRRRGCHGSISVNLGRIRQDNEIGQSQVYFTGLHSK